jgi:hypothetical protein
VPVPPQRQAQSQRNANELEPARQVEEDAAHVPQRKREPAGRRTFLQPVSEPLRVQQKGAPAQEEAHPHEAAQHSPLALAKGHEQHQRQRDEEEMRLEQNGNEEDARRRVPPVPLSSPGID